MLWTTFLAKILWQSKSLFLLHFTVNNLNHAIAGACHSRVVRDNYNRFTRLVNFLQDV